MAAADDFKILDEAIKDGKRSITLPDGRTFTLTQARTERNRLADEIKKTESAKKSEESSKEAEIKNAEKLVQLSKDRLAANLRAFNKGNTSESVVVQSQQELQTRQEGLARLTSATVVTAPATAATAAATAATGKPAEMGPLLSDVQGGFDYAKASAEVVPTKDKAVLPVKITKATVTAELDALGLIDTPENRLKVRESLKNKKTAPAEDATWEPLFKQNYPQYNWMFTDLDRTKYADVFDLFKRAQQNKMLPEEFDKQYIGTSFYRELQSGKKGRELSAAIGNFTWGSGNLAKFLTTATQYGYEGENLKQQAYKELFTKVDNKYVNDLAVGEVRKSTPYLGLKDIGKQYFLDIADSQVEQVLSGVPNFDGVALNRDDLIRKARLAAKATYGHLSEQIDAGLTLEELSASYKEKAARVLELDPNTMNFGADFSEALNYRKDGQPRVLSLGEWETELRTNDKYKYSFTKQANQDATDIGLAIARAFGKVG